MFKNIIISILSTGWATSLPFFYGKQEWSVVIFAVVCVTCIQIDDLVNDIKAHRRFKRKLAAELKAADREAQKKIG